MLDKDELQSFYNRMWSEFDRGLGRHERDRLAAILSIVETLERPNRIILDAGCGIGKFAEWLTQYGSVTGVDWSETGVAAARERVPGAEFMTLDFIRDDIRPLAGRFGLAVSTEVLEHVGRENRVRLVQNLHDCLVPGGFLILTTPNRKVAESLPAAEEWRQPEDDLLSIEETLAVIAEAGLILVRRGSTTFFEALWERSPIFRWLRARLPRDHLKRDFLDRRLSSSGWGLYTVVLASRAS
jgi:cyclopropane fatty-acyl-phospholipid synthase-like methyltransferase